MYFHTVYSNIHNMLYVGTNVYKTSICLSVVVNCGDPGTPTDGTRTVSAFTFTNTVTYTCNVGFKLVGNRRRHCVYTAQWSGALPTCQSKPHVYLYWLFLV